MGCGENSFTGSYCSLRWDDYQGNKGCWSYDSLKNVDKKAAERYFNANTLRVRTSRDTIETFDQTKIEQTLIVETGASENLARKIATNVYKELKNSTWNTSPHQ